MPLLALEMIGTETSISIGLLVTLLGIGLASFATALVSRTRTTAAVEQLRVEIGELKAQAKLDHGRIIELEGWRKVSEALDDAARSAASTTRGARPSR